MRKRRLILPITLVLILTVITVWYYRPPASTSEQVNSDGDDYEPLQPPEFVVPETPLGTLSIIIACLAALAVASRLEGKRLHI